ncbi:MAG: DNA-directed RNA polymerase [Acidilobaceae archaeon]
MKLFVLYEVEEWLGIEPQHVYSGEDLSKVALEILRDRLEGIADPQLGVIIAVVSAEISSEGVTLPLPGDPDFYFKVRYTVLAYEPILNEVVRGIVKDVREQGLIIDLGPIDGFVHKSQIIDENVELLPDKRGFRSESGKIIEIGDIVRARISQIAKPTRRTPALRVGLTMRQPYLGKEEYIKR